MIECCSEIILVLGVGVLIVNARYISDVSQTTHAIRRNYPVAGHFCYLFENMGQFFRQYFFAQVREEMALNRVQCSRV